MEYHVAVAPGDTQLSGTLVSLGCQCTKGKTLQLIVFGIRLYSSHSRLKHGASRNSGAGRTQPSGGPGAIDLFVKWRPAGLTGQLFAAAARIPRDPL